MPEPPSDGVYTAVGTYDHAEMVSLVQALSAGANDYLVKPIGFAVALARVRTQLAMQGSERALRTAMSFNELVLTAINDGIWDWIAADNRYVYSARMAEILGYRLDELDGSLDWRQFLHPDDLAPFEAALDAHLRGDTPLLQQEVRILDSLTGLPNRTLLEDRLERCELRRQREPDDHYAVCVLSIDATRASSASPTWSASWPSCWRRPICRPSASSSKSPRAGSWRTLSVPSAYCAPSNA